MTAPATPEPDGKDWTWVLSRPCPDCGYDASAVTPADIPARTREAVASMRAAVLAPDSTTRPQPEVWSALEYGAHVRDVCIVMGARTAAMLGTDNPDFADWNQDSTALAERYWEQDPTRVADELSVEGERIATQFEHVADDQWQRPGRRSNGSQFTVDTLARYFLHDVVHHVPRRRTGLTDVRAVVPLLAVALALVGCSSTTSGSPVAPSSTAIRTAPPDTHGFPADATSLAALLSRPTAVSRTAHVTTTTDFGQLHTLTQTDQSYAGDRLVAYRNSGRLPNGQRLTDLIVGGHVYLMLPGALRPTHTKPWLDVTHGARNALVRQFAATIAPAAAVTAPHAALAIVRAQQDLRFLALRRSGGAEGALYTVTADASRLPPLLAATAGAAGQKTLSFELLIDRQGRMRELHTTTGAHGVTSTTVAVLSRFGAPVRVTAPPAALVGRA